MVPLPKVSVPEAIALGTELVTWARARRKLPGPIAKSLRLVRTELEELCEADQSSMVTTGEGTGHSREADRVLDASWSASYSWCTGWLKLPGGVAEAKLAAEIRDAIFADGVRFTQFKFKHQWAESQKRLDVIDKQGLGRHFERLGGAVFLDTLRDAHARYGEALGITQVVEPEDSVNRREHLHALLDAIRRYVVQVMAYEYSEAPGAAELADYLLTPLRTWESRPAPSASEPAASGADAGDEPDALSSVVATATGADEPEPEPAI
jgi:hypothetical protein